MKSTVAEIQARFDADVARFSNLDTGQSATMDAPLCMDLVTQAAAAVTPAAKDLLDLGCGAGNYTLKMLQKIPNLNITLIDLSRPMLDKALERIRPATTGKITALQSDMRDADLGQSAFDIVLSAATFHHLRTDEEWQLMFTKIFRALRPGGSFWIFDFIQQNSPAIQKLMHDRYGQYLSNLKGNGPAGEAYRNSVFAYVEKEDTPRSTTYQLNLLQSTGFTEVDLLHKNSLFAAFGGRKP